VRDHYQSDSNLLSFLIIQSNASLVFTLLTIHDFKIDFPHELFLSLVFVVSYKNFYKHSNNKKYLLRFLINKLVKGFEPPTYGLQIRCSTVELHQQSSNNSIPHY
jgi:hypothetical protein